MKAPSSSDEFSNDEIRFCPWPIRPSTSPTGGGRICEEDIRWAFGDAAVRATPIMRGCPHIYHHLAPRGVAGVVLANGSMSSQQSGEGDIRRKMIEAGRHRLHGGAAGPAFLFHADPACLGFWRATKAPMAIRDRRGEIRRSTRAISGAWSTAPGGSFRRKISRRSPGPTIAGALKGRSSGFMRTCRGFGSPRRLEDISQAWLCADAGAICRRRRHWR